MIQPTDNLSTDVTTDDIVHKEVQEGQLQVVPGDEKLKKFNTIKWMHIGAAVFFLIQTIAYSAVDANITITPTVGFPTYCNELFEKCPGAFSSKPFQKSLKPTNPIWTIPLFTALASFDHFVSFLFCIRYADYAKMCVRV